MVTRLLLVTDLLNSGEGEKLKNPIYLAMWGDYKQAIEVIEVTEQELREPTY